MARHLRNVACPKCRERGQDNSGDNLGEYDDGSAYCWLCGYYVHATVSDRVRRMASQVRGGSLDVSKECSPVILPADVVPDIHPVGHLWLSKYDISATDAVNNRVLWSDSYQQLIFPYFDRYNNLVAWQGRNLGTEELRRANGTHGRDKKWFSQGDLKKLFHIVGSTVALETKHLVLVEDIVSAIKVGKVCPTLPLFGNNVVNRIPGLFHITNNIVIWLDPDMRVKTLSEANRLASLGFNVRSIFSDRDPKEHTLEEIEGILRV